MKAKKNLGVEKELKVELKVENWGGVRLIREALRQVCAVNAPSVMSLNAS